MTNDELTVEAMGIESDVPAIPKYKKFEMLKNITDASDKEVEAAFKRAWDKMY